ncbi:MAG TPA: dihydrolipoamide acetyltransferase family protein [Chloroflexota bacterium]|nr:dihydrolipoamide acetyltransferase family protein [Chloroflexota bacterium]
MPEQVVMPKLSDTMTEGTVSKWLKKPGDEVQKGEPLVEIETDKANIELESYASGRLSEILLQEGGSAPVGEPIGVIQLTGETASAPMPATAGASASSATPPVPVSEPVSAAATPAEPATPEGERAATAAEAAAQRHSPEAAGAVSTTAGPAPERGGTLTLPSPAAAGEGEQGRTPAGEGEQGGTARGNGESGRATTVERQGALGRGEGASAGGERAPGRGQGVSAGGEGTHRAGLRASPLARRLARERGLDLSSVHGSGPLGRIQKDDVEAFAPEPESRPPAQAEGAGDQEVALSRMQQTIARRMVEAKQAPHFYVSMDVDMQRAVEILGELNDGAPREEQVTINDLFVRACALALRDFPDVNAGFHDGKIVRHQGVHVGYAVAIAGGLVEPVIRDADTKSLRQLAAESKALAKKVREGRVEPKDYEGGTFSISNLGMYGVSDFAAIINPPHSAILAVGSVADQAVVVEGQVAVRKRCTMTLSADHRVFYGATAAEFLRAVKNRLEKPFALLG